jgi:hypothetical protein
MIHQGAITSYDWAPAQAYLGAAKYTRSVTK